MADEVILTERLEMRPLEVDAIDALIARDSAALSAILTTNPTTPIELPEEFADALPFIGDAVRTDPTLAQWWARLLIRRHDRAAVGSVGLGGRPSADGTVVIGYTVFPAFEGSGYATEGTRGLISWALRQDGVTRVRATIPPWHAASIRVATKAGMRPVGEDEDPDVGRVMVWEIDADSAPSQGHLQ